MKKIFFVFMIVIAGSSILFPQEETLLSGEITNGGFGGPVIKFTRVNSQFGVLVGGQGGWIINHKFVLGGGGYGLVNNVDANITINGLEQLINFGYGGVELHYICNSDSLLHFTVSTLIGAGAVSYRPRDVLDWNWDTSTNTFFVFEPTVRAMINVTTFFRIGAGLSYRLIGGAKMDNIRDSDLSGPSIELVLKFGKF